MAQTKTVVTLDQKETLDAIAAKAKSIFDGKAVGGHTIIPEISDGKLTGAKVEFHWSGNGK